MPGERFRRTPGGVCSLGLLLVWCPKYRRRVLGGRVARRLDELIERIAGERGWQIVAHEVMPDHVHLFVRVGPADAPAAYFAASVSYVSETTVRRDIEHQWDAVLAS
jgi:putative transposase